MRRRLFHKLIYAAADKAESQTEAMRLDIVNTMTTAGAALSILLAGIYVSLGHYESVWLAIFGLSICTASQFFLARGWTLSLILLVAGVDALVFTQNQLFHGLVPNHLFFFATATAPFVVFPPTRRGLAVLSSAIAFALWLLSLRFPDILFSDRPPLPAALIERVTEVVWVTSFGFALVPSLLLFSLTGRYHDEFVAAQQRRLHSAKLVSLGETAAGIAHEINNPLAIICGKAEALLEDLAEKGTLDAEGARASLEYIERNGRRITQIIASLRSLARQSGQDPLVRTNLAGLVEETAQLVRERFRDLGLQLVVDVPSDLAIACRPSEIMQVITNVLTNARDALLASDGDDRRVEMRAWRDGQRVVLTIANNGGVIAPDVMSRIFDPFFSTKPPNQGTGLGLSISQAILASHRGALRATSTPAWTTFSIELPASEADP